MVFGRDLRAYERSATQQVTARATGEARVFGGPFDSGELERDHGSLVPLAATRRRYQSSRVRVRESARVASLICSGLQLPTMGMMPLGCLRSQARARTERETR